MISDPALGVEFLICWILSLSQSIKCSQCGKVFKNTALANYHAEKSGHDQFEESTEEVCARARNLFGATAQIVNPMT